MTPAWRALFLAHPERFVVGSDTWVNGRWEQYAEIIAHYRGWLGQLPPDVAAKIAHVNGERLFAAAPAGEGCRRLRRGSLEVRQ